MEVEIAGRLQGVAVVDAREALRGEEAWCCKLHRLGPRYMRLKKEVLAVRFVVEADFNLVRARVRVLWSGRFLDALRRQ